MPFSRKRLINFWIFLLFASIFDIVFTFRIFDFEILNEEINFIMNPILGLGIGYFLFVKFFPLLALGVAIFGNRFQFCHRKKLLNRGMFFCVVIFSINMAVQVYTYFFLLRTDY